MALTDNLAAYWKFNESSGNAADSSGAGVTLTNNNTVGYAAGKIANAGDYGSSNTNKYFSAANTLGINGGAISHNFWVNISTAPTSGNAAGLVGHFNNSNKINERVFYKNDGGTLNLYFNRLIAGISNNGPTVAQTLTTGTWYMITFTYDGTTVRGYVNGTEIGNAGGGSGSGSDSGYFNGIIVGSMNGGPPTDVLKGLLDEYGVWSRALSPTEITTLYNGGAGLTYPFVLGPANVKTVDQLAFASVKTVLGLAVASIKNIMGLD